MYPSLLKKVQSNSTSELCKSTKVPVSSSHAHCMFFFLPPKPCIIRSYSFFQGLLCLTQVVPLPPSLDRNLCQKGKCKLVSLTTAYSVCFVGFGCREVRPLTALYSLALGKISINPGWVLQVPPDLVSPRRASLMVSLVLRD